MKKEQLNTIGISVTKDYTAEEVLRLSSSELCEPENIYRAGILRDFCEEFYASEAEEPEPITSSEAAMRYLAPHIRCLDHEECWVLLLDRSNKPVDTVHISDGTIGACVIDIQRIAKHAIIAGASGVILSHNHPSGNPRPSKADIEKTKQLKKALKLFDIGLVDHIIVGNREFFSFGEEEAKSLRKIARHENTRV